MIIYFYDGSTLECNEIEIQGGVLIADSFRYCDICDIDRIETA